MPAPHFAPRLNRLLARSLLMTALQISGLTHARAPEAASPPPPAEEGCCCLCLPH